MDHVMYSTGPIVPYVRTTQKQKFVDPRYRKYHQWKAAFRLWANIQGFPEELDLEKSYHLDVRIWIKGRTRSDLDNNFKAIADALFKQDRRIIDIRASIVEKSDKEAVEVTLREL